MNNVYKKANRSETIKVFEDGVSAVPWDLLRFVLGFVFLIRNF